MFLNTFVLSHKKESSDADRQSRVLFEGGGNFSCSLCSKLQPLLYTYQCVCSQSFPLHMSSYCFWMAENCCVSRRNILYNVGNGLLVIVVQCYPPSFLSSLNFFDKSLSCSLSAFQKCNNQSVLSANNYLPSKLSKKNGCTCMYFYSDVINCAHSPWKMM